MPYKESILLSICLSVIYLSIYLSFICRETHIFQAVTKLIWRQVFLLFTALRVRLKPLNLIHVLNQVNWIFLFGLLFHIHCSVFSGVVHGISIGNNSSDYLETVQYQSRRQCLNIQMAFCNNHACLMHLKTFCLVEYLSNFETISKLIFWVSMSSWFLVV